MVNNTIGKTGVPAVSRRTGARRHPRQKAVHAVQSFWFSMLCVVLISAPGRAANYALLVGINEYQQKDAINSLAAATADVRGVARTLEEVARFPGRTSAC